MIRGQTILCFASGYDAPPTSKHHVMHLLAENNRVLWVNYHGSRTPSAKAADLGWAVRKLAHVVRGLRKVRENLYVLTPPVIPLPGRTWVQEANRRMLRLIIRRALRQMADGPVQIWSFAPDISYLLGEFAEQKVVYYCVDDFASFSGYDRRQVVRDETDLCRRSSLVIATSKAIQQAKCSLNPRTVLVSHGVDYAHFAQALTGNAPEPAELRGIPHPRLGFFGLIRDWVNLDLVAAVAQQKPQWQFVFIGDADVDLTPCRRLANIHFLGPRPYRDLPGYCRGLDVGLIPFKTNELTRSVNPIKLREYLCAGLPVASTPLPEVLNRYDLVFTGQDTAGFIAAVESALNCTPEQRRRQAQAMAGETWPAKLEFICKQLNNGHVGKGSDDAGT